MKLKITKLTPKLYDKFNEFAKNNIACKDCKEIGLVYHANGLFRCPHCGTNQEFTEEQILDFLNFAFENDLI